MKTKEYRSVDKSKWGPGEWQEEPDKLQWRDEATGMACLIVRGPHGGWCGYVGVTEGHALFGKDYGDANVQVHGGLTYSDHCQPTDTEERGICHVPGPGEPDHVWWFGFDCAHAGDFNPAYQHLLPQHLRGRTSCPWNASGYEEYRDMAYVKANVTSLAKQLLELRG